MKAVRLRLRPPGGSFPGVDTALSDAPGIEREGLVHLEWLGDGSYTLLYRLSVEDGASPAETLDAHPDVIDFDLIPSGRDERYCFVHVAERELLSSLLEIVDEHALILDRPIRFVDDGAVLTVAGDSDALGAAYADASESIDVVVEWSGGYAPDGASPLARLTDRQREAIETAYDLGFYEKPRRVTYEDIADDLECAPSTANELLRRAEAVLVGALLDG